jgi:cytochrome c oxidase subunit 2
MNRDLVVVTLLAIVLTIVGEVLAATVDFYPVARADKGEEIETAFKVLVYLAIPVAAVVIAVLSYSIVSRRSSGPDEDGPPIEGKGMVPVAWVVVTTALTIGVIIYPGITGINEIFGDEEPELVVNVTGVQWAWLVDYPELDVSNIDELVLPVDQTVRFDITSEDVLHSFWVPTFLMKIDAVPGRTTSMTLTPTELGNYTEDPTVRVQCAELCGIRHSKMVMPMRVVTQEEFDTWVTEQKARPTPSDIPTEGTEVEASLTEFAIDLSQDSAPAGGVLFTAVNNGATVHNFKIVATDLAPDALPIDEAAAAVDEEALELLRESDNLAAGDSELVAVRLDLGSYVVFCNIPGHYEQGMYAGFTVESR